MEQVPEFIEKAILGNKTSLGDHPAFPPEEEDVFLMPLIRNTYDGVMEGIDTDDRSALQTTLNRLVAECQKEEESCREALEQLCSDMLVTIFQIPEDTIDIELDIVSECDMSRYRMIPDSTPDFEFEDIDEMKRFSDTIYQRRMVNCLISGISEYYANKFEHYAGKVFDINPKLMGLYSDICRYNRALLYNKPDTLKSIERSNSGCVTVTIGDVGERIGIKAEGVIFPVLLEYAIRGILEIASMKGLPDEQEKAEYIMGKTDYRLAENWDLRLGIPLWGLLMWNIDKTGFDVNSVGSNFIIMELSRLEPDVFNKFLQNAFKKTRLGLAMTSELLDTIEYNKGLDDFNNYIRTNNAKYSINDCDEYTSEELLAESARCGEECVRTDNNIQTQTLWR